MNHTASRRAFLKGTGAGLLLAAASGPTRADADASKQVWRNWSGSQSAGPSLLLFPASEDELVKIVRNTQGTVRCFGGGHSFSGLVPSGETLISVEALTGLRSHDPAALTATLFAGTRLMTAGDLLAGVGQSLLNQPDVNLQSMAGAISTATHGTGLSLRCMSAYVTQLRLVLSDGSVVTCSDQKDKELFDAARVAMGTCGVITEITFQNRATYQLAQHTYVMDLDDAMRLIDARKGADRHIEFFAFPHGNKALVKQAAITNAATTPDREPTFNEDELLSIAAATVRRAPWTQGMLQRVVGGFIEDHHRVGPAHRIFPSPRAVPFNEMEYSVPAEDGLACLHEVMAVMRELSIPAYFPIEFRYTAADALWLSPFYQRAAASISIHQDAKLDHRPLFAAVEPVFHKYRGRPHWGKLHTLGAQGLRELYPCWDKFGDVRRRVDPRGRFLNPYMRALLGVPG